MEIHQLRYFVAVAEQRSFSRAAEKVRVAQPSLSQQIQKLEAELGQTLFDRLARKVVLTQAGQSLLPFAHRILNELSAARRQVSDRGERPGGVVKLGMLPTIAPFVLERLLRRCHADHPAVELSVIEDVTDNLIRMVDRGEIDLAIISTCRAGTGVHLERWAEEPLYVALPANHRLATNQGVTWKELRRETVLVLHESHCLSRQIQKWCTANRVRQDRIGAIQLATLLAMVASGAGISLVPAMAMRKGAPGCVLIPFKGEQPTRELNLLRNASHHQSKAAAAVAALGRTVFIEMLR